jgi:hypothetical protein
VPTFRPEAGVGGETPLVEEGSFESEQALERSGQGKSDDLDVRMAGSISDGTTFALLHAHWSPREIVMHNPGGPLKIEAFRRHIRDDQMARSEKGGGILAEPPQHIAARHGRNANAGPFAGAPGGVEIDQTIAEVSNRISTGREDQSGNGILQQITQAAELAVS